MNKTTQILLLSLAMSQMAVMCNPSVNDCEEGHYCFDVAIRNKADLEELKGITHVEGRVDIEESSLKNLNGLEHLEYVEDGLYINSNEVLTDIKGLRSLKTIGKKRCSRECNLEIRNNSALVSLNGLENLEIIYDWLFISFNQSLENLDGLSNLEEVEDSIYISDNDSMTSISGLFYLKRVGGNEVQIDDNPELSQCQVDKFEEYLKTKEFSGNFIYQGNDESETCEE